MHAIRRRLLLHGSETTRQVQTRALTPTSSQPDRRDIKHGVGTRCIMSYNSLSLCIPVTAQHEADLVAPHKQIRAYMKRIGRYDTLNGVLFVCVHLCISGTPQDV